MKKVCVITSTRADYGILKPLLSRLADNPSIDLRIVATGTHLCPEYGDTYREIEMDGFEIHKKIGIQLSSDTHSAMSKSMGMALICFSEYFEEHAPDLLIVLGDRYEIMAVTCAATNQRIPVAHLHGGETTEGAVDECFRHSITKMSALHFTSCEDYRRRVIQLGEAPERVFNVGALGVENVINAEKLSVGELSESINFPLAECQYCVVTFHPVTLEDGTAEAQLRELIATMEKFPQMCYIITGANADAGGRAVNTLWQSYAESRDNCLFVSSLGMKRYLSALKHCAAMIGNSSSGILEGPASKIPTVDIGDRQKGRIRADSIIHCEPTRDDIAAALEKAFSPEFRELCRSVANPYGDGNTSERVVKCINDALVAGISVKKSFYDIRFEG
jgi:GDP/UDP-N,N'-diacetylbacillosamine 2-epimerase (hydrolysing)